MATPVCAGELAGKLDRLNSERQQAEAAILEEIHLLPPGRTLLRFEAAAS